MRKHPDIPRIVHRRKFFYGDNGEVFVTASGEVGGRLARIFGPSNDEIRSMLLRIRRHQKWPQASLAAVLGVPKHTVRKWEEGARNPSGAAKKLIWMVHTLIFSPAELLNDLTNLVTWGAGRRDRLILTPEDPHPSDK